MNIKLIDKPSNSQYEDLLIEIDSLKFKKCVDSFFFTRHDKHSNNSDALKKRNVCKYFSAVLSNLIDYNLDSNFILPFEFSDQYMGAFELTFEKENNNCKISYLATERIVSNPFYLVENPMPDLDLITSEYLGQISLSLLIKNFKNSLDDISE